MATKEKIRQKLMEIWDEVSDIPIDREFTAGRRGHLKITVANAMKDLGVGTPFDDVPSEPSCTCLPAGPGHDHSDHCELEKHRKARRAR